MAFDGQTYRGTHEEIVGTNLFFRRDAGTLPRAAFVPRASHAASRSDRALAPRIDSRARPANVSCHTELPPAKRARTTDEDEDEDEEKEGEESDGAGAPGGRADGGSERPPARWPLHAATDRSIRMLPVKLTPRLTVPVKGPAAAS